MTDLEIAKKWVMDSGLALLGFSLVAPEVLGSRTLSVVLHPGLFAWLACAPESTLSQTSCSAITRPVFLVRIAR